jgi:hypothetical protein
MFGLAYLLAFGLYLLISTGNGNVGGESELRFWIRSDHCIGGRNNAISFARFAAQFKGREK